MSISRPEQLTRFLERLGERYPHPAAIYIFGGSAVVWLGGPRATADIDYMAESGDAALREAISADVATRYDEPIALRRNFDEFKRSLKP